MKTKYLLGFDIGTYESKGVLLTTDGEIAAKAVSKHVLKVPKPGYAEHDPENDWWIGFKDVVQELLAASGINSADIVGIGCSAVAAGVTPVDEAGKALRNAILYGIDTRSEEQAEELNRLIGKEKLLKICGSICTVESFGPKIKWIRDNEPGIFQKTKHFTFSQTYLTARLTGNYCIDQYSVAQAQPLTDQNCLSWCDELCKYVVPKEMLPHITSATEIIGEVTKNAAEETGLTEGTPVICGTTDAAAEAVSVGVVEPGDTMIMYGSTIYIIQVCDVVPKDNPLWQSHFVMDNTFGVMSGMATAGSLTRWIRDNFAKDLVDDPTRGLNSYDDMFAEAEKVKPGSDGVIILPYFAGERMPIKDPQARGMIFGLNLSHTRGHIIRAALEGIGYGLCQNLDILRQMGFPLNHIVAVGGGTKSREWMQIVSDICGVEQNIPKVTIGASLGDAIMAGLGVKAIISPQILKDWVEIGYRTVPIPQNQVFYEKQKPLFSSLYQVNKKMMHSLSSHTF